MKFALWTYSAQILLATVGCLLFVYVVPQYSFAWFNAVPILFMTLSLMMVATPRIVRNKTPRQTVNIVFGVKVAKFFVAAAFFIAYLKFVGEQRWSFAITFLAFYFTTLIIETFFMANLLQKKA